MEFPRYGSKDNVYPDIVQIPYPKVSISYVPSSKQTDL